MDSHPTRLEAFRRQFFCLCRTRCREDWRSVHKGGAAYGSTPSSLHFLGGLKHYPHLIRQFVHGPLSVTLTGSSIKFLKRLGGPLEERNGAAEPTPLGKGKRFVSIPSALMFLNVILPGVVRSKIGHVTEVTAHE